MSEAARLPDGTLIVFYGDDFTGSSAVMEITAFAGLPTVLFLNPPKPEHLARFAGYRVIGIAGIARSQSVEWMDRNLPPVFKLMRSLNAPIAHYKVCSTFDSAPHVGSIGRAIDLGAPILGGSWQPVIVGDPGMRRYQAFGYLFAVANGVSYPLHEHPVMARHPVTPMHDTNLCRHLGKQTAKKIGLVDFVAMKEATGTDRLREQLRSGADIVFLDVLDRETLIEAGQLVWNNRGERIFGIGSQGFEAALVAYWKSAGLLAAEHRQFQAAPAPRIACVSGSVSPITAAQIAFATEHGFAPIPLDATRAVDEWAWQNEVATGAERALKALGEGRDPLVYTAAGPDDPGVKALQNAITTAGMSSERVNTRIGAGLGLVLGRVLREARLTRAVISGGDTSGHAASTLGVYALTAVAPVAPGSPLCRAHTDDTELAGLEIALKGGQVGRPDFFCAVKRGGVACSSRRGNVMRLKNKHALVTGGGRGIGLAISKALAREGATVAVADINLDGAKTAAATVGGQRARAVPIEVNVADPVSVTAMIKTLLQQFGRIDILVNNAGVGGNTPFLDTTLEEWNRIIGINLTGAFMVAQAVAREMVKSGGGKIVNIASLSGQRGGNGRAAYGSAKAGLELLTKVMAVELAPYNINVNNIAPGAIETEMAKFAHDTATRAAYNYLIPMVRYGTPEEIADAAVFLCSDEARYVHGHTLNVDGGFRAAGLMFGKDKAPPVR